MKNCNLPLEQPWIKYNPFNSIQMKYSYFLIAAMLLSCGSKEEAKEQQKGFCLNETLKNKMEFFIAERRPVTKHLKLSGEISYNPDQMVQFVSLVEGFSSKVFFSLGDYVTEGQLLAEIKSPELNSLQAEKNNLETQIKVMEREVQATREMFEDNIASERDLLNAEGELKKLQADYINISKNLDLFHYSPVKGVFEIKAPAKGYVVSKNINPGMQINDGDELFTISGLDKVWVMLNVYATDIQFVDNDMEVEIQTPSYPDEVFMGKITALSQVFDAQERVLKGRIVLENPDLKLKPGMSADIVVANTSEVEKIFVPVEAIIFDNNKNHVVIYNDDCDLEIRSVESSIKDGKKYFLENGVAEGEKVVVKNQLLLYERLKNQN